MRNLNRLSPLGKYIAKTLVDRDMTRMQLARAVGTSPQYLSYIMTGVRSGEKYIGSIIAVLNLDPKKVEKLAA